MCIIGRACGNFAASKAKGEDIDSPQFNFAPADLAYIANNYIHLDHDQSYTAPAGIAYTFAKAKTRVSTAAGCVPMERYRTATVCPITIRSNEHSRETGHRFVAGAEARLDVINLFDENYEIRNGTGVGAGAPQFGPRHTILAGLTQHF